MRTRDQRRPSGDVRAVLDHEGADAVERIGGDAAAIAQAVGELAVIDGAAAEGGFGQAGLAAVVGDFLEQLLGVRHRVLADPDRPQS